MDEASAELLNHRRGTGWRAPVAVRGLASRLDRHRVPRHPSVRVCSGSRSGRSPSPPRSCWRRRPRSTRRCCRTTCRSSSTVRAGTRSSCSTSSRRWPPARCCPIPWNRRRRRASIGSRSPTARSCAAPPSSASASTPGSWRTCWRPTRRRRTIAPGNGCPSSSSATVTGTIASAGRSFARRRTAACPSAPARRCIEVVAERLEREVDDADEAAGLLSLHFSLGGRYEKAWPYARTGRPQGPGTLRERGSGAALPARDRRRPAVGRGERAGARERLCIDERRAAASRADPQGRRSQHHGTQAQQGRAIRAGAPAVRAITHRGAPGALPPVAGVGDQGAPEARGPRSPESGDGACAAHDLVRDAAAGRGALASRDRMGGTSDRTR